MEIDGIYTSETGRNEDLDIHHLVVDKPDESNYEDLWSAIMLTNHMVEQEMFRRLWKCMEFRDIGKKKLYKML